LDIDAAARLRQTPEWQPSCRTRGHEVKRKRDAASAGLRYWLAAQLRFEEALALQRERQWPGALLQAGVAVECSLRSLWPADQAFDERHDLRGMLGGVACSSPRAIHERIQGLRAIWANDLRYLGRDAVVRRLRGLRRFAPQASDVVAEQAAEQAIGIARDVLTWAWREKWTSRSASNRF
jgi:hypothetical protein